MEAKKIKSRIEDWLNSYAVKTDEKTWKCKRCGSVIFGRGKTLPIYEAYSLFKGSHAGFGRVQEVAFPYCPECDGGIDHFADIDCIDF